MPTGHYLTPIILMHLMTCRLCVAGRFSARTRDIVPTYAFSVTAQKLQYMPQPRDYVQSVPFMTRQTQLRPSRPRKRSHPIPMSSPRPRIDASFARALCWLPVWASACRRRLRRRLRRYRYAGRLVRPEPWAWAWPCPASRVGPIRRGPPGSSPSPTTTTPAKRRSCCVNASADHTGRDSCVAWSHRHEHAYS